MNSVYVLFVLCSDFVYVILFPQLVAVIYMDFVNSYGVVSGFSAGLLLRLLGGDSVMFSGFRAGDVPRISNHP